jgi:hypothetical protein
VIYKRNAWLGVADAECDLRGMVCHFCGIENVYDREHVHVTIEDDIAQKRTVSGVCSEGCAIRFIQRENLELVPSPEAVAP